MLCPGGEQFNDLLRSDVLYGRRRPERPAEVCCASRAAGRPTEATREEKGEGTDPERERERERESVANGGPLSQPKAVLVDAWGARAQEHENPNVRKKPSPV